MEKVWIQIEREDRIEIRYAEVTYDCLGYEVYKYLDDKGFSRSILRDNKKVKIILDHTVHHI
jgi:hypothetical protein